MTKVIEQEKEHVSDNPVKVQDTEHVESFGTVTEEANAIVTETASELPPKDIEDEGMVPHQRSTVPVKDGEKVLKQIDTTNEVAEKEGTGGEVYIDLSSIVFDKDGIPEFTKEDAKRLKLSSIAVSDFESEIEDAREIIKETKELLDEDNQKELEKSYNDELKKIKEKLKDCDEKEKEKLELRKDILTDLLVQLPKNNPVIKKELTDRQRCAIKHIAIYQNVSRHDLGKLQKDGTISGLISSVANSVFIEAYVESHKRTFDAPLYTEMEEYKKLVKELEDHRDCEYMIELDNQIKHLKEKFDFAYVRRAIKDSHSEEACEYVKVEDIDFHEVYKYHDYIKKSLEDAKSNNTNKEYIEKTSNIENSLTVILDADSITKEQEKELSNAKKFVDNIQMYYSTVENIKELYFHYYNFDTIRKNKNIKDFNEIKKLCKDLPNDLLLFIDEYKSKKQFEENLDTIKEVYKDVFDTKSKEYNELEDKLEKIKMDNINPYKEGIRKVGFLNSFLTYTMNNLSQRGYYGKPESLFSLEYTKTIANRFFDIIDICLRDFNDEKEYTNVKNRVNFVSITFNNIIKYYEHLYNGTIDAEFFAQFDEHSSLKEHYFKNKEVLDPIIKEFVEVKDRISMALCDNDKFIQAYQNYIGSCTEYINTNYNRLNKQKKKNIKKYHKESLECAFMMASFNSYKPFIEGVNPLRTQLNEKRKELQELFHKETDGKTLEEINTINETYVKKLDTWYKENLLQKENEITKEVIGSFIHYTVGCSVIYAFSEFKDFFLSRNNNKLLADDLTNYLFNEAIMELYAFCKCKDSQTYEDYFKNESRRIAFDSIDFSLQREVNVDAARTLTISNVIKYAATTLSDLFYYTCIEPSEKEENKDKKEKNKKHNKKQKINVNSLKEYKKKAREKKLFENSIKMSVKEYDHTIDSFNYDHSITFKHDKDIYVITVDAIKDTRAVIKVIKYARSLNDMNIKKLFDSIVIDKTKSVSIKDAYIASTRISLDDFVTLSEKWYYNQFVDDELAVHNVYENGKKINTIHLKEYKKNNTLNLSEKIRYTVDMVLRNTHDKIINEIICVIKKTGINFENKSIAIKNNTRLCIRYLDNDKSTTILDKIPNNGNINFFKSELWSIVRFELNYDIINIKK